MRAGLRAAAGLLAFVAASQQARAARALERDTIFVSPRGPISRVGDGVARVRSGGTVVVMPGVYREPTVRVQRPMSIVGSPGAVLDGEGARGLVLVLADDVTIRDMQFRGVGVSDVEDHAAIRVTEASRCRIENNVIEDAFFGIALARVASCRVAGNRLSGNGRGEAASGNGIHVWSSRDITVENNTVTGHRDGIYLEFAGDSRISRNLSHGNARYGLHFMFSDDCRYEENVFRRNQAGAAVMYSKGVVMTANRFEDNWGSGAYGLLIKELTDARIRGNDFERNTTAVFAEGANRLLAEENRFVGNGWAIRLMASSQDARVERNDFVANSFDVSTNSRSTQSTFSGNYWDSYRGYDLNRDGVGDVPHRPVRLFSQIVERFEPTLILQRSFLVAVLDGAERVLPSLTPERLVDAAPSMRPLR